MHKTCINMILYLLTCSENFHTRVLLLLILPILLTVVSGINPHYVCPEYLLFHLFCNGCHLFKYLDNILLIDLSDIFLSPNYSIILCLFIKNYEPPKHIFLHQRSCLYYIESIYLLLDDSFHHILIL